MTLRIALCQLLATDSPEENLRKAEEAIRGNRADLYVFPEMFLSSYTGDLPDGFLRNAMARLQFICKMCRCAVCIGAPVRDDGKLYNSLIFMTDDQTFRYDKIHLASFGIYSEERFTAGDRPVMVEFKRMRIGLSICYDIMFPEVHRAYGKAGADIVIASSASMLPSRKYMEIAAPARSMENTVYTVYINNIGPCGDGVFFGGSGMFSPLGDCDERLGDEEEVKIVTATHEEIEEARKVRRHLQDLRKDVDWSL